MGEAGESARVEVERVRRQLAETLAIADRLAKRIDRFEAGGEGERITAAALVELPDEYLVHHDLHIEGSDANVDHVVVGPTGVYVIDTKHWAGRATTRKGPPPPGRHPQRRALTNLAWETACVAGALAPTGVPMPVPVMSMTGTGIGDRALEINGTWVLPVEMLNDFLTAGPPRIPSSIARVASETLSGPRLPRAPYPSDPRRQPARSTANHALIGLHPLHVPLTPSRAAQPNITSRPASPLSSGDDQKRRRRPSQYPPAAPRATRRPSPSSGTRRGRRRRKEQTKWAAELAVGVILIAVAGVVFRHPSIARLLIHSRASALPMTVASTPPSNGTSPPSSPPAVEWSCPGTSAGWTATFPLTGSEQANLGTWALQTATGPQGPWTTKAAGEGVMRLTGLQPERAVWIRGGNISSLEIAGSPIIEGRITTPTGC